MKLFGKSNKSQPSVGNSSNQSSSTLSSVHDPPTHSQSLRYQQVEEQQARRPYPARSQSHRHSSTLSLDPPPVNVAASVNAAEASPPSNLDRPPPHDHRFSYQQNLPEGSQQYKDEPKRSLRNRLFGSSKDGPPIETPNAPSQRPVNRRVSVRRSEVPTPDPAQGYSTPGEEQQRLQPQDWTRRQGSSSHLPSSTEEDENNLDPFLQHTDHTNPQIPIKDLPYPQQQNFGQQPRPEQFHDQYRPTLARVDTNQGQFPSRGDLYSPEQHSGSSGNSALSKQPQYISYSQPEAKSPVGGQQQQGYQAFQPQPQQPPPLGQPPAYTHDNQHFAPPPPPHGTQGFQEVQSLRKSGQPIPQTEVGASKVQPQQHQSQPAVNDSHNLQIKQPPPAQQFSPPTPSGQQQYQPYDPATGSQGSNTPNEGPAAEHNPMPPLSTHGRSNPRPADSSKSIPGPPTRESSLHAPPPGAGQPNSPGVQSFNTGVVPQQAQGQPYRGSGKPEGETGRDTPPPGRSVNDMTEEEVQSLLKEHDVLREKYQKVKRYFFEQQNQVHQLQNTLANQRMSVSRTSLDDSEYGARFNRLDGLVAQLAHSIRKSWKSIPPMMEPYVNKEAVTAGAKEMIIVGRSTIAEWIFREIFEKYFHPDLETGLSIQLKTIQQNIRRFAPPAITGEEEEATFAKIVNWRLATIEGLSDQIRSAQATTNRQRLIELLNEKLIADLERHLNESASPELHGNVPMIIELAVGIAMHLPMESRDVTVHYFEPGHHIVSEVMKIESGIAALTNPCADTDAGENASLASAASDPKDAGHGGDNGRDDKRGKSSMFSGLMSTKKPSPGGRIAGGGSQVSLNQQPPGSSGGLKEEQPQRVRLAAGLAVQIRGRAVLVKAPVYTV